MTYTPLEEVEKCNSNDESFVSNAQLVDRCHTCEAQGVLLPFEGGKGVQGSVK